MSPRSLKALADDEDFAIGSGKNISFNTEAIDRPDMILIIQTHPKVAIPFW